MNAVLYKDLTVNRNYLLILAGIVFALAGAGIYMREPLIFLFFFAMIGTLYFTAVFARDAESHVNRTLLVGPITRNQLVDVNYLALMILGVVAFVTTAIMAVLTTFLTWREAVVFASASFALTLILSAMQLPLFYKYGPEKAKLFLVVLFILVFVASGLLSDNKEALDVLLTRFLTLPVFLSAATLMTGALGVTLVSLLTSRAIMAKKEF